MKTATKIAKEIEDFKTRDVQIVPGLLFNHYNTLNQVYFYYNSKFQSGDTDDEGDKKYFFNITKNPCKVFSKSIDFDTSNIRMITAGGGNPMKTWFMERDLKYWMRDIQFGKVLNRIFAELPVYGSVVIKIVEGRPYFVDLRNFVMEQSADTLDSSNYLIELHHLTIPDFKKIAKKMKWDKTKVDEVMKRFREMRDKSHITLWERYGEVEVEDGEFKWQRTFTADVEWNIYDVNDNIISTERGIELSSEDWDGNPYWEFHSEKMAGRWLGIGVVETLFEPQIRENEIANLQSKASYWAALRVFQTRDAAINRNLATDVRNGQIINVDSEITQIDMSDRNLAFFNQESAKWLQNRAELTFSYDVVQGERLPAGTPLGSAQLSVSQTLSYFEGIQENVAMAIKEMIYEVIIPQFQKENTKEHTIRLVGEDLDTYINMVKYDIANAQILNMILKYNKFPSNEEKDAIVLAAGEAIKQKKEKILPLPKDFYKDVKYDIDIDITGESVDTRVRSATKFAILQAITADPTMLQDPAKRKLLASYAEDGGINPNDFFELETKGPAEVAINGGMQSGRAGGGVSAPQMGPAMPGQQMTQV